MPMRMENAKNASRSFEYTNAPHERDRANRCKSHDAYSLVRCVVPGSLWACAGCSKSSLAPGLNVR